MRKSEMRDKTLQLMRREAASGGGYLSAAQIASLINQFEQDQLNINDRKLIADHVLANYLHEDEATGEALIDWILNQ